jgi:hypothetical protein
MNTKNTSQVYIVFGVGNLIHPQFCIKTFSFLYILYSICVYICVNCKSIELNQISFRKERSSCKLLLITTIYICFYFLYINRNLQINVCLYIIYIQIYRKKIQISQVKSDKFKECISSSREELSGSKI